MVKVTYGRNERTASGINTIAEAHADMAANVIGIPPINECGFSLNGASANVNSPIEEGDLLVILNAEPKKG